MKVKVIVTKNPDKGKKSYRIPNLNKTHSRSKSNYSQKISPIKTSPIISKKSKPKYKPKKVFKQSISVNAKELSKNKAQEDLKDIDKYLDYYIEKEIDEFNSTKNNPSKTININDHIKKNKSQSNLITPNRPNFKANFDKNKNKMNIKIKNKSPIRLRKFNINKKKSTEPLNIKKTDENNSYFNYIDKIKNNTNCRNETEVNENNENNDNNTIKNLQEQIETLKKENLEKESLIENMKKQVEDYQKEKNTNNGTYLLIEEIKSIKQKFNLNDSNRNSNSSRNNNNNGNDISLFDELKNSYLYTKKLIEELKQENENIKKQINDKHYSNVSDKLLSTSHSNEEIKKNIFISPFFNSKKLYQESLIKNNLSDCFINSSNFQDILSNYIQTNSTDLNFDNINDIESKQLSEIRLMIKMTLTSNEIPEDEIISFFMDHLMNYSETVDKFMFTYLKLNNFIDKQLLHDYFFFIALDENKKFNILNIFKEIKSYYIDALEKPDKNKLNELCTHTSEHMNLIVKECRFYDNLNTGLVDYHKFISIFSSVHEYDTSYDEENHKKLFNYCLFLMRNYSNVKQFELFKLYYRNLEDDSIANRQNESRIKDEEEDEDSSSNNEKEKKKSIFNKEIDNRESKNENNQKSNEEKKNSSKSNSLNESKKSLKNGNKNEDLNNNISVNGMQDDFKNKNENNEKMKNILQNKMLANLEINNLNIEDEKVKNLTNDDQNNENICNENKNSKDMIKNNVNSNSNSNNTENSQNGLNKNQSRKASENNDNNLINNLNNEELLEKKEEKNKRFSDLSDYSAIKRDSNNMNARKSSNTSPSFSNEEEFLREVIQQTLNKTNDQNDNSRDIIKEDILEESEKNNESIIENKGDSAVESNLKNSIDSKINSKEENKTVSELSPSEKEEITEIVRNCVNEIFARKSHLII